MLSPRRNLVTMFLLLIAPLPAAFVGCTSTDASSKDSGVAVEPTTPAVCSGWPREAETLDASTMSGCSPKRADESAGSAGSLCDAGTEYALVCNLVSPDPGLDCRVSAIPPGGPRYCCPCRP